MLTNLKSLRGSVASMLTVLLLMACAAPSRITPPAVVDPPELPPPAVKPELVPSGTYWAKVCSWLLSSQQRLSVTLPMPEECGKTE